MSQEEMLKMIKENPGIRQSEVAEKCGRNSYQVRALLKKGLIRREFYRHIQGGAYRLWSNV